MRVDRLAEIPAALLRAFAHLREATGGYRPERHFMRGPGPKCAARARVEQAAARAAARTGDAETMRDRRLSDAGTTRRQGGDDARTTRGLCDAQAALLGQALAFSREMGGSRSEPSLRAPG